MSTPSPSRGKFRGFRAGVGVDLTMAAEQMCHAIAQVLQNPQANPPGAAPLLSEREWQVMQRLAQGQRDRAIAQALYGRFKRKCKTYQALAIPASLSQKGFAENGKCPKLV